MLSGINTDFQKIDLGSFRSARLCSSQGMSGRRAPIGKPRYSQKYLPCEKGGVSDRGDEWRADGSLTEKNRAGAMRPQMTLACVRKSSQLPHASIMLNALTHLRS